MKRKYKKSGRALIFTIIMIFMTPMMSWGSGDTGRDWYCSEPDEHTTEYKKHVQEHLDRGAEVIAEQLEKIYCNKSLTAKEKQDKTIEVLNTYLLKVKVGMGD